MGWYCIRYGLAAFRHERPTAARAVARADREGVPTDMDVEVQFGEDGRRVLTFHCSFRHHLRQWVEACSATGRRVTCDDFVIPRREERCEYRIEEIPDEQMSEYDTIVRGCVTDVPVLNCCQEVRMWDAFAALVAQGKNRTDHYDRAMLLAHAIMDAAMASAQSGGSVVAIPAATLRYAIRPAA